MTGPVPHPGAAPSEDRAVQVYADDVRPASESGLDCVRRFVHADACARHLRADGAEVVFSVAVDAGGEAVEAAAAGDGVAPGEWIEAESERLRAMLAALEVSCDRAITTAEAPARRALQQLFLALLERDLLYTRDPQPWEGESRWFLRSGSFAQWCATGLERLGGTAAAVEAQRNALGEVAGVELTATALGLGDLVVFTPFADAVGEAEFVAVSPRHPQIESIVPAARLEALGRSAGPVPAVQTDLQAGVPGVDGLLPVVVTPAHEPLALASLGIPARAESDRSIASQLTKAGGLPVKTRDSGKPRATVRYKLADLPASRPGTWGAAVPVVHCRACGVVAIPSEELPLAPLDSGVVSCPSCGAAAERDPEVLSSDFEGMWSWALLSPVVGEAGLALGSVQGKPRLVVSSAGDGKRLLHQRIATNLLQGLAGGEGEADDLLEAAAVVGQLRGEGEECVGGAEELNELVASEGGDVVRFALLDAAAVGTATSLYPHSLRHAKRFLEELRELAEPGLRDCEGAPPTNVDRGSRLRRRLLAWCGIAAERVAEAFASLETSRVTHNLTLLLKRIQDFEELASADGELTPEDREAEAYALSVLVELAAPCVPNMAAELRALADEKAVPVGHASTQEGSE
jgi:leucyl-tRNA synthetase